jgi:hypothetical protein
MPFIIVFKQVQRWVPSSKSITILYLRERPPIRRILHISMIFEISISHKRDFKVICGSSIISSIMLSLAVSISKFYKKESY